ncbi:MAG: sigma-54 dependent transcriptional regulator [Treponema sp.]|nr:sigma-54 dependent transcriptional regulator [Treponema sp.]
MKFTLLIIDDEKNIREGLAANFEIEGYTVKLAADGKEGLELLSHGDIDLVITDLRMPGITGEEVVRTVTAKMPGIPVIVLTGHGSIDAAVEAMRNGAYDFLTKPLNLDQLSMIVKRALQNRELSLAHNQLKKEIEDNSRLDVITGKSAGIQKVIELVKKVAPTTATVLITGESGVGKEVVAAAIHNLSSRKDHRKINVNCTSFSESLLESELFGHEKGAFTGADTLKKGHFEEAHESTIFLDEIGEINKKIQVELLRVIQEKQIQRVGSTQLIDVDVRIIAATNRDLEEEVKNGNFREDLFYRLNVVRIHIPPLRERKEDIPLLIERFLKDGEKESGKTNLSIDQKAKAALVKYNWPGNIRELKNCIISAAVMCDGNVIKTEDLTDRVKDFAGEDNVVIPAGLALEEAEKIYINATLASNKNNKTKAAEVLGITRKTLDNKISQK